MARVAERLGVSHAALFHRTGTKEGLMLRALCPGAPACLPKLELGPQCGGAAEDELVAVLSCLLSFHREVIPHLLVLHGAHLSMQKALDGREAPPVMLRRKLACWLERAAKLVDQPASRPAVEADLLLCSIEARCFNTALGGSSFVSSVDDGAYVRELVVNVVPWIQIAHTLRGRVMT
jgi:AcrR family transcriptional regulator